MTGDKRWAFTFLGPFAAKEHFCYLPGSALERAENTSIEFFALKIPRKFDFWFWCGIRFTAPAWRRWGAYRIFEVFYLVRIFTEARGDLGLRRAWRDAEFGVLLAIRNGGGYLFSDICGDF
jgi:hypothetical protein